MALEWEYRKRYPVGAKCIIEQYKMLNRCSEKKDVTEWNEWRKGHRDEEVFLQGADLRWRYLKGADLDYAHLEGARLINAHLEGAYIRKAHLEGADLFNAHLEGAVLWDAHLEGAYMNYVHLQGAKVNFAHLDGATVDHAHLEGANLWYAHLEGAFFGATNLEGANLEKANLLKAELPDARLYKANLEGAKVCNANLERANLAQANLEGARLDGANLMHANIEGAYAVKAHFPQAELSETDLRGANLSKAFVDGGTVLFDCKIDKNTDFRGVGLRAARVDPGLLQLLEYNVRRKRWEEYYRRHWYTAIPKYLLIWPFWQMSDYGRSSGRIIASFFVLAALFATTYLAWPSMLMVNGKVGDVRGPLHALYFSVVTMTTLGFGDIHANPGSSVGQALLMCQVLLGYILLAALVTRFAVLFQAGGPAGRFSKRWRGAKAWEDESEEDEFEEGESE